MRRPLVYYSIPKMSTKVISTKVESELYDELLETCNVKGCTISQFVKDACLEAMDKKPELGKTAESTSEQSQPQDPELITRLQDKITKLESDLSSASSTISKQNQTIEEFYELVPERELRQRRFDNAIHAYSKSKFQNLLGSNL